MNYINNQIKEPLLTITKEHIGQTVILHGSIYKIRKMSGFSFLLIRTDRQVLQTVFHEESTQIILPEATMVGTSTANATGEKMEPSASTENLNSFPVSETAPILTEESCVVVTAKVIEEPRSKTGYELHLITVRILSTPAAASPVVINTNQQNLSLESHLNHRMLTLRNEKERAVFKLQAGICEGLRLFFAREHFTEIHTPKLVSQGAEGGANIFQLDYFGKDAFLAQSPQFYKQMMVGVFERVYEIGPVFRAEKHDTARHLNEYTSVDFEMGYIESFTDLCRMECKMLEAVMAHLQETCAPEISLLNLTLPVIRSIPSLTFQEAKELTAKASIENEKDDLSPEEEKYLSAYIKKAESSDFVFITHYPSSKRPFYAMEDPTDPSRTLSFDLLMNGLEITTGGQRIHSYTEQLAKLERRSMNPENFESYLMMHKHGMPPHGGLGLGLERLTAKLLGYDNVRYATLFPRDINRLVP